MKWINVKDQLPPKDVDVAAHWMHLPEAPDSTPQPEDKLLPHKRR